MTCFNQRVFILKMEDGTSRMELFIYIDGNSKFSKRFCNNSTGSHKKLKFILEYRFCFQLHEIWAAQFLHLGCIRINKTYIVLLQSTKWHRIVLWRSFYVCFEWKRCLKLMCSISVPSTTLAKESHWLENKQTKK